MKTPAKLNMHLRVHPLSETGFHPLRSWFRVIRLYDRFLSVGKTPIEDEVCRVQGPEVPADSSNLIHRAFNSLREAGVDLPPLRVRLAKKIPLGAGLGGGSSNAALALLAARQFAQVPDEVIRRLAPKLGSDVPFFVSHHLDRTKQATVLGRGEVVEPIIARQRHSVLLLLPNLHVSTPEVFKVFDTLPPPPDDGSPDFAAWSWLPAMELLPLLRNDLEAAAFMIAPSLGELRDHCERQLARPVRMSGSGSSLFTLYDADAEADEARESSDLPVASIVV